MGVPVHKIYHPCTAVYAHFLHDPPDGSLIYRLTFWRNFTYFLKIFSPVARRTNILDSLWKKNKLIKMLL